MAVIDFSTLKIAYAEQISATRYAAVVRDSDDLDEGRISFEVYGETEEDAKANAADVLLRLRFCEWGCESCKLMWNTIPAV